MEPDRYKMFMDKWIELNNITGGLTEAEIKQGWHFCPDWDFLLISPDSKEGECCTCTKEGGS